MILADLHSITESQIHRDLVFLIDHLLLSNSGLHLVLASRMDPPWPLARWRVRGELSELRTKDMRFTYEEVFQFLNQLMQLELSSEDITALHQRTEGWIAGLQMACVSIQGRLKPPNIGFTRPPSVRVMLRYSNDNIQQLCLVPSPHCGGTMMGHRHMGKVFYR